VKPGHTTTEFWLTLLSVILPSLASAFQASPDPRIIGAGVAISGIYTLARTAVKVASDVRLAAEAKATAAVVTRFDPDNFGGMTASEKAAAAQPAP